MTDKHSEPRLETRELAKLLPYPRQKENFQDLPEHKLERLARAARKGCLPPIEVLAENHAGLPSDTILRGHQRKRAHERNGATEVQVLVRYDLSDADLMTIDREFLEENFDRRHQDSMGLARVALNLFQLKKGRRGKLSNSEEAEARDLVGKEIGMSGRNLQRYWNVLHTPVEVQDAVSAKQLPLVLAERVTWLAPGVQAKIAQRIHAGEAPRDVVADYVPGGGAKGKRAGDPVTLLLRGLARALRHVEGQVDRLSPHRLRLSVPQLVRAQQVIADVIARASSGGDAFEGSE